MITFTPRDKVSNYWTLIGPILSIILTVIFGLLIFTFLGFDPAETLYQIFISPFSRIDRVSDIFVKACPLIIVGIGLMFCFKANVWNIGAEGQFIMGALLAGAFALLFPNVETKLLLISMFFIGFLGGALWAFIPAILKTKLNVNEILVSLMLVYVAMLFIDFIVRGPLRDPMSFGFPLSKPYPDGALINKISYKLIEKDLNILKNQVNPDIYNGATLIGLNGISVKSHGNANPIAFSHALNQCHNFIKQELNMQIIKSIKNL